MNWLPLLQRLTQEHEDFVIWKHADKGFAGVGDIDAMAPEEEIGPVTQAILRDSGTILGAQQIIICDHVEGVRLHFLVSSERWPTLGELDVCHTITRLGSRWATPTRVLSFSSVDARGIRRIEPPAEAIVSLVLHGISPSGRDCLPSTERRIIELGLAADYQLAHRAIDILLPFPARSGLRRLIGAIKRGTWNSLAARMAWCGFLTSSLLDPRFALSRALHRASLRRRDACMMIVLTRDQERRALISDRRDFLSAARRTGHRVINIRDPRPPISEAIPTEPSL